MTRHVIDDLILPIMREIKATALAAGVVLPEGIEDLQIKLDPPDEDFLPSMGQDAAKVYEIDHSMKYSADRLCRAITWRSRLSLANRCEKLKDWEYPHQHCERYMAFSKVCR